MTAVVECPGHPAGPNDPMGETVFCDGTCQPNYAPTSCEDCGRPIVWDEAAGWYQHVTEPERGCFLIRPADVEHDPTPAPTDPGDVELEATAAFAALVEEIVATSTRLYTDLSPLNRKRVGELLFVVTKLADELEREPGLGNRAAVTS